MFCVESEVDGSPRSTLVLALVRNVREISPPSNAVVLDLNARSLDGSYCAHWVAP